MKVIRSLFALSFTIFSALVIPMAFVAPDMSRANLITLGIGALIVGAIVGMVVYFIIFAAVGRVPAKVFAVLAGLATVAATVTTAIVTPNLPQQMAWLWAALASGVALLIITYALGLEEERAAETI